MKKDSRIYIAGHTGQIGYGLAKKLQSDGYENVILRTHDSLDLLDQKSVWDFFEKEKPEYVFYCAGTLGTIDYFVQEKAAVIYNNLMMQANVINSAVKNNVKKLLYVGSGAVYGSHTSSPFQETAAIDSIQQGGMEAYAVAKIAGLELCKQYHGIAGSKCISVLPTHVYGTKNISRIKNTLVEELLQKMHQAKLEGAKELALDIWGTGKKCIRQFIYLDDLVDALIYIMDNYDEVLPVNIASEEAVSLDELAHIIREIIGYTGTLHYQEDKTEKTDDRLMSVAYLREQGWKPHYTLREGIQSFYTWYLDELREKG
ncbi:NAD-dependent epimerase/dehydratase family protein [Selenomonas sputigena]|uniref:NAD-dependent epimerase/dehydratase family protein n=1 Tax=Selenomonas sputigena TaxID=69823 RepID=UPI002234C56F|nr:NAD-dependent epimerase/dehydratase family protein [Selenomonas sputigena]UZE45128.1 NAD-dependent epimerase/dehydratase family protein [Selenomonas sputigena]